MSFWWLFDGDTDRIEKWPLDIQYWRAYHCEEEDRRTNRKTESAHTSFLHFSPSLISSLNIWHWDNRQEQIGCPQLKHVDLTHSSYLGYLRSVPHRSTAERELFTHGSRTPIDSTLTRCAEYHHEQGEEQESLEFLSLTRSELGVCSFVWLFASACLNRISSSHCWQYYCNTTASLRLETNNWRVTASVCLCVCISEGKKNENSSMTIFSFSSSALERERVHLIKCRLGVCMFVRRNILTKI